MENYFNDWHTNKYYQRVKIYLYLEQYDRAVEDFQRWLDLTEPIYRYSNILGFESVDLWVFAGRLEHADSLIAPYEAVVDTLDQIRLHAYTFQKE